MCTYPERANQFSVKIQTVICISFSFFCYKPIQYTTRMHSSRMRTARLLPISPSMHCSWGVYLLEGYLPEGGCTCPGDVPAWGDVPALGVYLLVGGVPAQGVYLLVGGVPAQVPPCGQTDTCKNITFADFVCGR